MFLFLLIFFLLKKACLPRFIFLEYGPASCIQARALHPLGKPDRTWRRDHACFKTYLDRNRWKRRWRHTVLVVPVLSHGVFSAQPLWREVYARHPALWAVTSAFERRRFYRHCGKSHRGQPLYTIRLPERQTSGKPLVSSQWHQERRAPSADHGPGTSIHNFTC